MSISTFNILVMLRFNYNVREAFDARNVIKRLNALTSSTGSYI